MIIWLASYPRSGNTLLRTICRHCFNIYSYADDPIKETGFQSNPGLGVHLEYKGDWQDFYQQASQSGKVFLVKTHRPPIDERPFIYIVRDGRSAIRSYQKYHQSFNQLNVSLESLIVGDDFYGDWSDHYCKWNNRPVDKIIMRYENLVDISKKNLNRIAGFINYRGLIKDWVNPLEKLKALEPRFFNQQQTRFIPDANWSGGTEYIFNRIHRPLMIKLGYYDDNKAAEPVLINTKEAKEIVERLINLVRHLVTSKNDLSRTCNEQNSVIENLSNACEERLTLINRLTKEMEIKSLTKENESLSFVAKQRLALINQLEAAKEDLPSGFKEEINTLKKLSEQKKQHIKTLNALIANNNDLQTKTEKIAEARLRIIKEREKVIYALRKRRPLELLRLWLQPKLGTLYHYHPRPIKIPEKYYNDQKKTILSGGWPLLSIVTPSYNQAEFIERTIQSILQQQYPKLEYLIQDGGSEDGTSKILEKYEDRLARWESVKDEGQSDALNKCFAHATGSVMAYLNSDDLLLPGSLHYVAHYFAKHPEVDVVYGHRVLMDEYDQEIGRWVMPPHDNGVLSWSDYIPQETMFWRREIWDKAGGFIDTRYKFAMDWELILRFRDAKAKMVRLPRFLGSFRIHPNQKTSSEIQEQGSAEMALLRKRCIGRTVSDAEIHQQIRKYLIQHVIYQKLYHAGILRY